MFWKFSLEVWNSETFIQQVVSYYPFHFTVGQEMPPLGDFLPWENSEQEKKPNSSIPWTEG